MSLSKKIKVRQLLAFFSIGIALSLSTTYGLTQLQAKTLNTPTLNPPVSIKLANSLNAGFSDIQWTTARPSPIGRTEAMSAVADSKLYVFGGYVDTTFTPTKRSDIYNPATNTWTQIADLPVGLTHAGTAVNGNDIYVAGGYPAKSPRGQTFATRDVWKYNIVANTWERMPSLPAPRGSGALEIINGELHFFGGVDTNRIDRGNHWVLSLNGATNWTTAAALPNPRSHMADAVLDGKLYAIGGQVGRDHIGAQAAVHSWNPATNTWTAVTSLPKPLSHTSASTFVVGDRIIVLGGMVADGTSVRDVIAYDPVSDAWETLTPLPQGRHSGIGGYIESVNKMFYSTGGGMKTTTYQGQPVLVFPALR